MRFPFLFNGRGIAMRCLPSATFGATGSSRMLRILTEFSEENSSPERNEMLVVSLRRSLIREPQPPELGGKFGPGMEGARSACERSEHRP